MRPSFRTLAEILVYFSLILISTSINAQWTQKSDGLEGCPVTALHLDGNQTFAGSSVGVYSSVLTGDTWSFLNGPSSPSSQYLSINCIAGEFDNLFAGTPYGVMHSSNGGEQWTALRTGLERAARSLLVSNNKIYAGTFSGGVFRSENNGTSWTPMNNGLSNSVGIYGFEDIAGTIYIATTEGVFQTADEGASWQAIHPEDNLPFITSIAVKDNMLFAGTFLSQQLFISSHDGTTWSPWVQANTGLIPESEVNALVVHGGTVYAGTSNGLYQYNAAGNNWLLPPDGILNSLPILSLHSSETHLLAGASPGVYFSTDNGGSWTLRKSGLTCTQVYDFVALNGKLFAETNNGLFVQVGSGSAWSQIDNTSISGLTVFNDKLFASGKSGIVVSDDEGLTWQPASSGMPANTAIGAIAGHGNKLFAGLRAGGSYYTHPVYVSSNEGVNWSPAGEGLPQTAIMSAFASKEGTIYAGADAQVYKSIDDGATWTLSSTGLPPGRPYDDINFLMPHHDNLYAGFYSGGIYRSSDEGLSWTEINNGFPATTNLFAMATTETNLFVGGRIYESQFGVYTTANNGDSWASVNTGLPMFQNRALIIHDNTLFGSFLGDKPVWSVPVQNLTTGIGSYPWMTTYSACNGAEINAYPNPAHASIHIDVDEHLLGLKEIIISDISGKPVNRTFGTNTVKTVNISDYVAGMYVVRVVYDDQTCYTKFVKQ